MTVFFDSFQIEKPPIEARAASQEKITLGEFFEGDRAFDLCREFVLGAPLRLGQFQSDARKRKLGHRLSHPARDLQRVCA
jgi:hypothetical protein